MVWKATDIVSAHNHGELKVHFSERVYVCVTWEYHKKLSEPTETQEKKIIRT